MAARAAIIGLVFGFALSRMGFSDWGEVHRMLAFADLRLLFSFAAAVVAIAAAMRVLARGKALQRRPLHKGTLVGGALFGVGWSVTGACPSAVLVQLGEGRLAALATLAGIVVGTALYRPIHARWLRWDRGSCDAD